MNDQHRAPAPEAVRKHTRKPRVYYGGQVAVKARHRTENETAVVQNLSEGGVLLLSAQRYAPGTEILLYVPLEVGPRKGLCMVSGRIIRVQQAKSIQRIQGYGVQFAAELSKSCRQLLADFVAMKQSGKIPDAPVKRLSRISRNHD